MVSLTPKSRSETPPDYDCEVGQGQVIFRVARPPAKLPDALIFFKIWHLLRPDPFTICDLSVA